MGIVHCYIHCEIMSLCLDALGDCSRCDAQSASGKFKINLPNLAESASVTQGPLVASVINLWQVQKQLASLYLLHLHELFKVFRVFKVVKVFKAAGVFKVVKFV